MSFAAVVQRLQKLENPYPGLRPFEITESHLFFGRDQQVGELVKRLERNRFLAVVGASGSGKSSLVLAGLIPALERGGVWEAGRRWRTVVTQPAGAPFERLAFHLSKAKLDASHLRESSHGLINVARQLPPDESLLLIVDQFEELFRYKDLHSITAEARRTRDQQAADAAEFVQLLLEASRHHPPIFIVLTMRSDYLGDCAEFRDLPETLNDCQYLIPRMTRQQRKEAIEGPLGRVGIAPGLVQRMLNDAGDEPDQLPVLQHALMRTWAHWRKADPQGARRIELSDYEAIGRFDGALNQHADELLAGVTSELAACIFKRLTARGRGNRERRDPATLAEIWAVCGATTPERQAEVTAVIDHFRSGDATFLRPLSGPITPDRFVDITHESLIRLWRKLRNEWLPEEQLSAKLLVDVAERARNWKTGNGELLSGLDLDRVTLWDQKRNKSTAWAQHYVDQSTLNEVVEFLDASRAAVRRRARRRQLLAGVAILCVVAIAGWVTYRLLERQRIVAEMNEAARQKAEAMAQQADEQRAASDQDLQRAQTELVQASADSRVPATVAPSTAGQTPRVYIQVRNQADIGRAREIADTLRDGGFSVPPTQVLETGPSANELRFFRQAERAKAEEIARAVDKAGDESTRVAYLAGFENSRTIRENHFELWLAPVNVLPTLVKQLNDPVDTVRKTAGGRLARDHRANAEAIAMVLSTMSAENLGSLTSNGRINALYFLTRSELSVWTDKHRKLALEAIERIRKGYGDVPVGEQTSQALDGLEQKLMPKASAR